MNRSVSLRGVACATFGLSLIALPVFGAAAIDVPEKPTFNDNVAPILHENCVSCHQPGQIGPMSLRTYDEARPWAKAIAKNVKEGVMPPWHADAGFGPFANDPSLNDADIETLVRWAKRGAPEGDGVSPEPPPVIEEGWLLGEPDYIVEFDEHAVPAEGPDGFQNFYHETNFDEDRFITGIEVRPGNRQVVHHVLLWQSKPGGDNSPDSLIGGWAAGAQPDLWPEGTGRLLKKGATLIGDFHYHPSGEAATDKTRIGLHFGPAEKEMVNLWVINTEFEIPAGDPNYEAKAKYTFPQDAHIHNVTPHMHYRGKDFSYVATYPDGRQEEILKVSNYDFNWQTTYEFEEPLAVPAGTRIDCTAHWDNSRKNKANPDPTKNVRFGNESFDEMMIGFVDYTVDEGVSPRPAPSPVLAKIEELQALYPGDIWRFDMEAAPGQGVKPSALHLPMEGDGGWYVEFANIVGKAFVRDIIWDGDAFTAKADIPGQGTLDLSGTADREAGTMSLTVTNPDGSGGTMQGSHVQ